MSPVDVDNALTVARRLADEWGLVLGESLSGATCSLVLDAGNQRVLKVPFPHAEEASAWRTVEAFSGHGGVELLRQDPLSGSLLMPCLQPGTTLFDEIEDDFAAVEICADLILSLRSSPFVDGIPLARWYRSFEKLPDSPLAAEARRVYAELLSTAPPPILLHGDLHHFNILRHGASWVAIDPKGLVGDPSFEVVGFMRNPIARMPGAAGMRARLERFADRLGDPIERLWGWSFVDAVSCASSPGPFDWKAAQSIWDAQP